ncbi:MAG: hypothetical protein ACQEVA_05885 [Myxococcota bacterium]
MKIGNDGFNAGGKDDLLERMERAHRREAEAANSVDAGSSFDATRVGDAQKTTGASQTEKSELETHLLETASAALEGEYDGPDDVRGAVVETIVDTRYGEGLARSERSHIVETLQQTLVDDREFRAEVDNMLILAARQLAQQ